MSFMDEAATVYRPYWPEGMSWRDYADECSHCGGPDAECRDDDGNCSNTEESELE